MFLLDALREYIHQHLSLLVSFQLVCILLFFVDTVGTSIVFSQFVEKRPIPPSTLRNVVILFTAKATISGLKSYLELRIFPGMFCWWRNHLFEKYLRIQAVHFDDRTSSADMRHLNEVAQLVQPLFFWTMTELIPSLLLMLVMMVYFLVKHPVVGLLQLASSGVNGWVFSRTLDHLSASFVQRFETYDEVLGDLDEKAQNVMNIVLMNQVQASAADHARREETWLPVYQDECEQIESMKRKVMASVTVSAGLSLWWMYKHTRLKEFVQSLLFFSFYTQTVERILDYVPEMMRQYSRLKLLTKALAHRFTTSSLGREGTQTIHTGRIEFRDVSFAYPSGEMILSRLSWTIPAGSRVALRAPSGSGKSTLMKLMMKLYRPTAGEIWIDGTNVSDISTSHLRDSIHYVNQRTLLFHDTVLYNVMYGSDSISRDDAIALIDRYQLGSILGDVDKKVDYGGVNLSLGMQKVMFLLRGVLKSRDPNVRILVLDEPLSNLDPETRRSVTRMLRNEIGSRTLIVITHDDVGDLVERSVSLREMQS